MTEDSHSRRNSDGLEYPQEECLHCGAPVADPRPGAEAQLCEVCDSRS